jgi:hypothetical protein
MSLCSLSYLGGVLDRVSAISCGSDAVTCPVTGRIIRGYHASKAWYLSHSTNHYRCIQVLMAHTGGERITDTFPFWYHAIQSPPSWPGIGSLKPQHASQPPLRVSRQPLQMSIRNPCMDCINLNCYYLRTHSRVIV